jgi:hypothetical protein
MLGFLYHLWHGFDSGEAYRCALWWTGTELVGVESTVNERSKGNLRMYGWE